MLEKPDLDDTTIISCLCDEYGVRVDQLAFLPLGADLNTVVYRAVAHDATQYFVKLRRGDVDEASVSVPMLLSQRGVKHIIPPIPTQTAHLWASLETYALILYPFVAGRNGFEVTISNRQRIALGATLKKLHTTDLPVPLSTTICREAFAPRWREAVASCLARIENETFDDPVAAELAAFLYAQRATIRDLVRRAEQRALMLQAQTPDYVLCHGDIHAWNLLIGADHTMYIVDWDTLIFAPKERDLMFVGSGFGGNGHTVQEENRLFYRGYGHTSIHPVALAYYLYERIIEDIAVICEQIMSTNEGGKDRIQALELLKSNFRPNSTIEIAYRLDTADRTENREPRTKNP